MPSRRKILAGVGAALLGPASGCTLLQRTPPREFVSLFVTNSTDEPQRITVEVVPDSLEEDLSENYLFRENFALAKYDSDGHSVSRSSAFRAENVQIRVRNGPQYIGSYEFIPDCPPDGTTQDGVGIRIESDTNATFSQNYC